jgi:hypothetical protein
MLLPEFAALAATAASANAATWREFLSLLGGSRIAHVCTLDAVLTAAVAVAAVRRDARLRGARGGRLLAVTALAAVPLAGPLTYLLLRPVAAPTRAPTPALRRSRRGAARASVEAEAYPPPPPGPVARVLRAAFVGAPSAAAVFALSVLVVLMPSRVALRRRLRVAKRRVRRVASFVFQGSHIERERVPVRQVTRGRRRPGGPGCARVLGARHRGLQTLVHSPCFQSTPAPIADERCMP